MIANQTCSPIEPLSPKTTIPNTHPTRLNNIPIISALKTLEHLIATQPIDDNNTNQNQIVDLFKNKNVEHQNTHTLNVQQHHSDDRAPTQVGEHNKRSPPILVAIHPLHQTTLLHPNQLMRQAALLPLQNTNKFQHPHPLLKMLAELDKNTEIKQQQTNIGLQITNQPHIELRNHIQITTPNALLTLAQPTKFGRHIPIVARLVDTSPNSPYNK